MIEVSAEAVVAVVTLLVSFGAYVGRVQHKLGKMENQVNANKNDIHDLKSNMATKQDIDGIKITLTEIKEAINKLFDLDRERANAGKN